MNRFILLHDMIKTHLIITNVFIAAVYTDGIAWQ